MAFIDKSDLKSLYKESKDQAHLWREDYPSYERLADNGLMPGLDKNLPEVNDGTLAASLFKLPKRIVSSNLSGTVKSLDRDEAWVAELANLVWQNDIVPHANTQAPFIRKWKDAVRKAAIYGSVPLITLFVETEGKRHADFIVGQPQDVTLEPGKVSDYDSDVEFWDIYYSKLQLENMIEQAQKENKGNKSPAINDNESYDSKAYNKWNIPALKKILASDDKQERSSLDTPRQERNKDVRPKGFKFCIAVQKGVNAPYYMYHSDTNETVREWSNPDPTGDSCIHFLYCYQDFINPYGIGIVKLAGGTQNVLDYMRQADVLATQLGLRPPINIAGDADSADLESIVYAQDALWFTGNAVVKREELANGVYEQLPSRIQMYKTSLNQLIPTGDTSSTAAESGDPTQSKTPAGVKLVAANLSIDDEDFKDNLYITYAAVAKSMINTHFANMEGTDLMKLSDDEREILMKAGMDFPKGNDGEMSNQLEIVWDTVRATFDFTVDPENDKAQDDADKLEGLMKVAELTASDPTLEQDLAASGKKLNKGELFSEIISLTSDNDKIITDISPEDEAQQTQGTVDPQTGQPVQGAGQAAEPPKLPINASINYKDAPPSIQRQMEAADGWQPASDQEVAQQQAEAVAAKQPAQPTQEQPDPQVQSNVEAVMKQYGVNENIAAAALSAEHQGYPLEDIISTLQKYSGAKA